MSERLEGERLAVGLGRSERMMRAAHRQHRSARAVALVEDIDLYARVAATLERYEAQQHRLARTRGPHDHHLPDLADMGGEPERRRAGGRRTAERRGGEEWCSTCR